LTKKNWRNQTLIGYDGNFHRILFLSYKVPHETNEEERNRKRAKKKEKIMRAKGQGEKI
jgi:hypothetical protein